MTSTTAGRAAQAARNDDAILAAAREVFLADPRAPIAAVAERAGIAAGTVYRYFPSKTELVAALVAALFILRPTAMWLINLSERLHGGKSHNALG